MTLGPKRHVVRLGGSSIPDADDAPPAENCDLPTWAHRRNVVARRLPRKGKRLVREAYRAAGKGGGKRMPVRSRPMVEPPGEITLPERGQTSLWSSVRENLGQLTQGDKQTCQ